MKPSDDQYNDRATSGESDAPGVIADKTPPDSLRRRLTSVKRRVARAVAREGATSLAMRKATQSVDRLIARARIRWQGSRPWIADSRPVFLFVSHRCGGGTEQHVRHLSHQLWAEGVRVVVVRPSRAGFLLWEERDSSERMVWCRESSHERSSLEQVIASIAPVHAHVHHTLGVPMTLIDLLSERGVPYDWTIHDYFTVCPRIALVNGEHLYCGAPDESACNRCLALLGDDQGRPVAMTIEEWRWQFSERLGRARRVLVPSSDVRDRIERYFPHLRVMLRPHPEALPDLKSLAAVFAPGEPVRVAVVGTITAIKGSKRLLACAREALAQGLRLEFHVIGSTDRDAAFSRLRNVRVWGHYQEHEVYARLAAAKCHLAFLPSVWPESFMYTLSVVMASGFFTVCFDLGAQASRLKRWGWGQVLPLDATPDAINQTLLAAAQKLTDGLAPPSPPPPARYADILGSYYGFESHEREHLVSHSGAHEPNAGRKPHFLRRSKNARFH